MITGIMGRLGWNLGQFLQTEGHRVSGTFHQHWVDPGSEVSLFELDLSNPVQALVQAQSFPSDLGAIVHCAAISNVDYCEKDRQRVNNVNVLGTELLVSEARKRDIPLIYFSTDFVFRGNCGGYTENSAPDPKGTYSKSKFFGEFPVLAYNKGIVLRYTPIGYRHRLNHHSPTLIERLIDCSHQRIKMGLFLNKTFSPVSGHELQSALSQILSNPAQLQKPKVLHICCKEQISVYEIGRKIEHQFNLRSCCQPTLWPDNIYTQIRPQHSGLVSLHLPSIPLRSILKQLTQDSTP